MKRYRQINEHVDIYQMSGENDTDEKKEVLVQLRSLTPTKKLLEQVHVFTIYQHDTYQWIYAPLVIKRLTIKTGWFKRKERIFDGFDCVESIPLKETKPLSTLKDCYDIHQINLKKIYDDINQDRLCWSNGKIDAIRAMNEVNHHMPASSVVKVEYMTLYEALSLLDTRLPDLYTTGTLKPPTN